MLSDFDAVRVRRAIGSEALSLLTHGLLLPFGLARSRHVSERSPDLRTIVFVHGLAANRSGFLPLQGYLRMLGYKQQYAFGYRSSGSLEAVALKLKREIDKRVRGGRIDIIAHSMGGLVSRFYLQRLGGARRIDRLITLGTPHQGTHAANFIPARLVRQLLPDSPFIRTLNALPEPANVRTTSFVAGRDILVQPIEAARCPFGNHIRMEELGHVELLFRAEVFHRIRTILDSPVGQANPVE